MHPRSPGIGLRPIRHKHVISETLVLGSWPICWLSTEETKPKTIKQTTQEQNGKHTKSKPKSKQTVNFKNCSLVCVYHCAQLPYTTQHRTVLIIFPLILQTIIVAQMLSTGREGEPNWQELAEVPSCHAPFTQTCMSWIIHRLVACTLSSSYNNNKQMNIS